MQPGHIALRLRRKLQREAWLSLSGGSGLLLLSFLAAVFTFWAIYVLGFMFFGMRRTTESTHLLAALSITALLFPLHTWLDPQRVVRVEVPNPADPEGAPIVLFNRRQDTEADMDPDSWRDSLRHLLGVFCFAPILLRLAFELIQKGVRLLRLDLDRLGPVVELLTDRKGRTPFAEIFSLFPGLDPRWLARALHDIEGVVFLNSFPAGMSLTPELRTELGSGVTSDEQPTSAWPEELIPRPDYVEQAGAISDEMWEANPGVMPQPRFKLSELAFTLIVRFVCGGVLGFGAFCWLMFGPRRRATSDGAWRAEWFQSPSFLLPLIFILGGGVICVLTTPRWMWRGGLG